jgi:hypothetical protein
MFQKKMILWVKHDSCLEPTSNMKAGNAVCLVTGTFFVCKVGSMDTHVKKKIFYFSSPS